MYLILHSVLHAEHKQGGKQSHLVKLAIGFIGGTILLYYILECGYMVY